MASWAPSAAEQAWARRALSRAVFSSQTMADSNLASGLTSKWVGCPNPLVLWSNPSEPLRGVDTAATLCLTAKILSTEKNTRVHVNRIPADQRLV